jgi:peptidyl-prolyl cis-trans isomerase B (cyclophilin B)
VWLYDETPHHKAAFLKFAETRYWDDYTFNRVIKDFVAQGGCPDEPEHTGPHSHHLLAPEFASGIKHDYGALGAGRDDNPGCLSASCQFYIVHNRDGLARLDGGYTVYGHVVRRCRPSPARARAFPARKTPRWPSSWANFSLL